MTAKSRYDAEFLRFMSFLDSREYNSLDQISSERIIMLKPNDICRYLNVKAYGTPTPHQDDHPSHARSNTLKALKKCYRSICREIICNGMILENEVIPLALKM